jgi:hypothetical protein
VAHRCRSALADTPRPSSVTLRRLCLAAKVIVARTSTNNQWVNDEFFAYCHRKLREAKAEVTQENLETLFTAMCENAIPAGNA